MAIQVVLVFAVGWAAFWASGRISHLITGDPATRQLALKALMAVFSFVLITVWRHKVAGSYGLTGSTGVRWTRVCMSGLAMGAVSSLVILLAGGRGMQAVIQSFKFYQIVLFVWLGSSIAEEIFTRGWAQGALEQWRDVKWGGVSVPVLTGAVLFSSMHVSLFFKGVDRITATVVVCSTLLLGLAAGKLRERHKGLGPAIAIHIAFNVGGMFGGILYTIGYRVITGRLPFPAA
ncbi:MAG: CPBP family intramembrane metalloprotease [Bryobacterales bacterium]|nr:CPBP family intramembrane metalloprotease [Bryobacterales bacterium]